MPYIINSQHVHNLFNWLPFQLFPSQYLFNKYQILGPFYLMTVINFLVFSPAHNDALLTVLPFFNTPNLQTVMFLLKTVQIGWNILKLQCIWLQGLFLLFVLMVSYNLEYKLRPSIRRHPTAVHCSRTHFQPKSTYLVLTPNSIKFSSSSQLCFPVSRNTAWSKVGRTKSY